MSKETFRKGLRNAALGALYVQGIAGLALAGWGELEKKTGEINESMHQGVINQIKNPDKLTALQEYSVDHIHRDRIAQQRGEKEILAGVIIAIPTILVEGVKRGTEVKEDGNFKRLLT